MPIQSSLSIPPWVSHRTYTSSAGETRSILLNHLTHELVTLDDDAARVWEKFAEVGSSDEFLEFCASIGFEADHVGSYLGELESSELLAVQQEAGFSDKLNARSNFAVPSSPGESLDIESLEVEGEFRDWCQENGFLFSTFLEVSYRCNHRCVHCFNPGASHSFDQKPQRRRDELTLDEYKGLIDDIYEAGVFRLTMSGGEFFLRKDAFELIAYARAMGISVEIFTNGFLLNESRLNKLAACWPESVSISIYSANPALHDSVTKVAGSWEKSVSALRELNRLGIRTKVKCPLMRDTVQGYELVRDLADSLGAIIAFDPMISAGNDGALEPVDLNVSDFGELVVLASTAGSPVYVGCEEAGWNNRNIDKNDPMCGVGCSSISVTPEGDVHPCVALADKVGSVRSKGWIDGVWHSSRVGQVRGRGSIHSDESPLSNWQNKTYGQTIECGTHDRCEWCSRCIGGSLAEHGDAMKPSQTQCTLAAARREASTLLKKGLSRDDICNLVNIPTDFGRHYEPRALVRVLQPHDLRKSKTTASANASPESSAFS